MRGKKILWFVLGTVLPFASFKVFVCIALIIDNIASLPIKYGLALFVVVGPTLLILFINFPKENRVFCYGLMIGLLFLVLKAYLFMPHGKLKGPNARSHIQMTPVVPFP